jgi:hypothetical protein
MAKTKLEELSWIHVPSVIHIITITSVLSYSYEYCYSQPSSEFDELLHLNSYKLLLQTCDVTIYITY